MPQWGSPKNNEHVDCPDTSCKSWGGGCIAGELMSSKPLYDAFSLSGCDVDAAKDTVAPAHILPEGPRKIALVHVGKTGGTEVSRVLAEAKVNFTHLHPNAVKVADPDYTPHYDPADFDLFIVPLRDPVFRLISSFNWHQPVGGIGCPKMCWFGDEGGDSYHLHKVSKDEAAMYDCIQNVYPVESNQSGAVNAWAESLNDGGVGADCGEKSRRCVETSDAGCGHISFGFNFWLGAGGGSSGVELLAALRGEVAQADEAASGDPIKKRAFAVRIDENDPDRFDRDIKEMFDWLNVPEDERLTSADVGGVADGYDYPLGYDKAVSDAGLAALTKLTEKDQAVLIEFQGLVDNP